MAKRKHSILVFILLIILGFILTLLGMGLLFAGIIGIAEDTHDEIQIQTESFIRLGLGIGFMVIGFFLMAFFLIYLAKKRKVVPISQVQYVVEGNREVMEKIKIQTKKSVNDKECPNCHKMNERNSSFCQYCGSRLEGTKTTVSLTVEKEKDDKAD